MFSLIILPILALVSISIAQKDPLKDFCRIHGHQTTVVDRHMYIDGGLVNWAPLSADSINYTSTWFKDGDLENTNDGFPRQFQLTKNDSVPSVQGGVLWADSVNKIVYLYGGEFGNNKPEDFQLWYYDIVYKSWNRSDTSAQDIRRASWGAGVAVQDRAKGYYYGGWLTNSSVPSYNSRTALKNMLVYDMLANSFRNQSGPDDIPRAEGVMLYLPAGDAGLLVYFGGVQLPYGNETTAGLPMTDIYVYDIGNDLWYKETASGDEIPGDRRRFCAGAAWAEDKSSYNIYLFGGASIDEGVGYGDVWILSLPSFMWIKFWPREEDQIGATFPHHSLSCDVINSQMIIMGGHFPNLTSECDVPDIYGQHGLDLGKANADGAKWALFNPNLTTYKVPTEILKTIGGGPTGGATILAPTGGWAERDLQTQFARPYTPGTRTPTRYIPTETGAVNTPSSSASGSGGTDKAAVIGGAVGGAIGGLLLVVAVGFCLFFWRRKRKRSTEDSPRPPSELPSQPISYPPQGIGKASVTSTQNMHHHSPSMTQYAHTPQGSPPPSDHAWSQYGSAAPDYPHSPSKIAHVASMPLASPHHRNPSDQSYYNPSLQSSPAGYYGEAPNSPAAAVQEMPIVRSPPALNAQPQAEALNISGIDPYFAKNPPRVT